MVMHPGLVLVHRIREEFCSCYWIRKSEQDSKKTNRKVARSPEAQ